MAVPVALGRNPDRPRTVNLDSDPEPEQVVPRHLCRLADGTLTVPPPECTEDQFPARRIEIVDTCAGAPYTRTISTVQDDVYRLGVTRSGRI